MQHLFEINIIIVLGLVFGSFITAASYRIAHSKSLMGRSMCPICKNTLGFRDLIPVFSFIVNLGVCRYCKTKISWRYPAIEMATMILFLTNYYVANGNYFKLGLFCVVSVILMIIIVIDFEHYIIPDSMQLGVLFFGIIYMFAFGGSLIATGFNIAIMTMLGAGLYYGALKFLKKEALGWGDVKFFAVAGLYIDIDHLSSFLMLSGISGILIAIWWRILGKGEAFPFGPSLCLSLYLCIAFPEYLDIKYLI